jgi:hypothetical protein
MIDMRALDDDDELGDLPPLDGVAGDDEAGDESGPDGASEDLPPGSLDEAPSSIDEVGASRPPSSSSDDANLDGGDSILAVAFSGTRDEGAEWDLRDSAEATNLSIGDDWLVAFAGEDVPTGDDAVPEGSLALEDVIESPSAPAESDSAEDGPVSTDDPIREADLPPLDVDEEDEGRAEG